MALRLTIAADIASIAGVLDAFDGFAAQQTLDERVRRRAGIVLDEVLSNLVAHGRAEHIAVRADVGDGQLVVEVEDDGRPFDPTRASPPNTEVQLAERHEGGLGVHLMMRMMDEVRYERRNGKGVLTLVQHLDNGKCNMKIEFRDQGGVTVVRLSGRLDTTNSPTVRAALDKAVDDGATKLVLDFEAVDFVSSAGLRVLLAMTKRLKGCAGGLRVCNLNETVSEVFEISGFTSILEVFDDLASALV